MSESSRTFWRRWVFESGAISILGLSNRDVFIIVASVTLILAIFLFVPPVAQDPAYHQFADTRTLLSVNNFWNVASNVPFLIVGIWGIAYIARHGDAVCLPRMQAAYIVFFSGILLTGFGSSYYHLSPANEPLVWDRLPMTIGFAGLFAIVIGEFISVRAARRMLIPILLIAYSSVEYWAFTESRGAGDLRPYAIVQFFPMLLIPLIVLTREPSIGVRRFYWYMLVFYVMAKIFEQLDEQIFALGGVMSGHSLKHVAAAMTPATLLYALMQRRRD